MKLRTENEALKKSADIEGNIEYKHGVYFTHHTGKEDGPYCQRCWDKDRSLIRLQIDEFRYGTCAECKTIFDYQAQKRKQTVADHMNML